MRWQLRCFAWPLRGRLYPLTIVKSNNQKAADATSSSLRKANRLSTRRTQFVAEYAINRNGAAAAVRAGYSERSAKVTASRLLTDANVRAVLAVREAENARVLNVTRNRVVAEIQRAIAVATEKTDAMAMIAGWREIAKMCGFYAPSQSQRVTPSPEGAVILEKLRAMSDEELAAFDGGRVSL